MKVGHYQRLAWSLFFLCWGCGIPMLFFNSCHETLPPRLDPSNVFASRAEVRYILHGEFGPVENDIQTCIKITNNYDETLQARAILSGVVSIVSKKDTSYHRTSALDASNLFSADYNRTTQVLTFDPGTFIHLKYTWDFIDDFGRNLRDSLFAMHPDPSCPLRHISTPQTIVMHGYLRIFDRTAPVFFGPIEFTFTYADVPIGGTDCPLVTDDMPCGSIN